MEFIDLNCIYSMSLLLLVGFESFSHGSHNIIRVPCFLDTLSRCDSIMPFLDLLDPLQLRIQVIPVESRLGKCKKSEHKRVRQHLGHREFLAENIWSTILLQHWNNIVLETIDDLDRCIFIPWTKEWSENGTLNL